MKFFFDNNLSPRFGKAIHILSGKYNHSVTVLKDRFDPKTPDVKWLKELKEDKIDWVIISGDFSILKNAHERDKLIKTNFTFFALTESFLEKEYWKQIKRLVAVWPQIIIQAKLHPKGTFFSVPYTGKIKTIPK